MIFCDKRDRLLRGYSDAAVAASHLATGLGRLSSPEDMKASLRQIHEANVKAVTARKAYQSHIRQHKCSFKTSVLAVK